MAHRVRNIENAVKNQENAYISRKGGVKSALPPNTKRLALGEIGNEVSIYRAPATRKALGDAAAKVQKKRVLIQHFSKKSLVQVKVHQQKKPSCSVIVSSLKCKRMKVSHNDADEKSVICTHVSPVTLIGGKEDLVRANKNVVKSRPVLKTVPDLSKTVSGLSSVQRETSNTDLVGVEDIDKESQNDPFQAAEYVNEIYTYLRELEMKYPIKADYLAGQEITSKMRAVLVDWLVDVHQQFHLLLETLYLTVSIIDRYLQEVRTTTSKKLQLVGVAAMFVACKFEEMYAPEVGDFVYICDNAYTKEEILCMENCIVQTLKFSFSRPIPLSFLRRYSKAAHAQSMNHTMAKYFLELCLVEYEMCHYFPSLLSAAAMYLSLWLYAADKKSVWTKTLAYYSKYSNKEVILVAKKVASVVVKASTSRRQAVTKKYAQSKFLKVSCCPLLKSLALKELAAV